jgi:hypothetical protein
MMSNKWPHITSSTTAGIVPPVTAPARAQFIVRDYMHNKSRHNEDKWCFQKKKSQRSPKIKMEKKRQRCPGGKKAEVSTTSLSSSWNEQRDGSKEARRKKKKNQSRDVGGWSMSMVRMLTYAIQMLTYIAGKHIMLPRETVSMLY